MSSISFPSYPAMATFLSRAAGNVFSPAGAAVAVGAAVVGGVAYYLTRTTSNNQDAQNIVEASNNDAQLTENVSAGDQTEPAASLFASVTGSIKGWATSFVSFLSGLVTASFRATNEEPVQGEVNDHQPDLNSNGNNIHQPIEDQNPVETEHPEEKNTGMGGKAEEPVFVESTTTTTTPPNDQNPEPETDGKDSSAGSSVTSVTSNDDSQDALKGLQSPNKPAKKSKNGKNNPQ